MATVVGMLCPKISTSWGKLAPTGRHGRHVFATLSLSSVKVDFQRIFFLTSIFFLSLSFSSPYLNETCCAFRVIQVKSINPGWTEVGGGFQGAAPPQMPKMHERVQLPDAEEQRKQSTDKYRR